MKSKEKPVAVLDATGFCIMLIFSGIFEQDMAAFAVGGQWDVMNIAKAQQGIDSGSELQRWGGGIELM